MYEINGKTYTAEQIAEAAKAYNLSVDDYVTKLKAKYEAGKSQGSATPTASVEPQPSSTESKSVDTSSVSPEKPKPKKSESDAAARFNEILSGKLATGPAETVEQVDQDLTGYTLNTLGNIIDQSKTLDDRIQLAYNAFASEYPGMVGPVPQALEKLGVDVTTKTAVKEITKAQEAAMPVGQFTDVGKKATVRGEVENVAGALINAFGSIAYSALESVPTLGIGLASDIVASSISDYNIKKAESAGKSVEQLFEDGEAEIHTPLVIGALSYSLEKIGLKGVGNSINNLKNTALKQTVQYVNAFGKEGSTEYAQSILENYSERVAEAKGEGKKIEGDVARDIVTEVAEYAVSKEALESLLQGGFGGVGAVGIAGGFNPGQARSRDENERINNNIKTVVDAQEIVNNPQASKVSKQAAKEVIKTSKADIKGDVELGNNRYRVMTPSDRRSIDKSFSDLNKFKVQYQTVLNDTSIDDEVKQTTLKGIEAKAQKAQDNIFNKRVAADAQIQELKKTGKAITALGFDTKVVDASELDTPLAKEAIEKGVFGYMADDTIVLNKQAIKKGERYSTARHELFHRFLQSEIAKNPEFLKEVKGQVRNGLVNLLGSEKAKEVIGKIESDPTYAKQGDQVITEELMAYTVEALKANPGLYKTSGFQKIKNFFKDLLQGITGITLKTDDDVLKFLNDFNRSFDKGRFTRAQKKFGRGKLKESGVKFAVDFEKMYALDDKLNAGEITVEEYDAQMDALMGGVQEKAAPSEEVEIEGQTFTVQDEISEDTVQSLDDKLSSGEIDIDTYFEQLDKEDEAKEAAKPKEKKARKPRTKINSKKLGNAIDALVPPGTTKKEYDTDNINKVAEKLIVGDMLNPLIKKIATYYGVTADNVYGQSFEDFFSEVKGERLIKNIQKFNPEKNDSLAGYVIGSAFGVRNRVKEALAKFKKLKDADDQARVEGEDIATETAEDTINRAAESKKAAKEAPSKIKYSERFDIESKMPKLKEAVSKAIGMSIKKYQQELSKNVSISPFAIEFRQNLANLMQDDMIKYMKDYGYEQFLKDAHKSFLRNSSITFLAKHPVFRQVIEKKIKGEFVAPTKVSTGTGKFKYEYMLPDGSKKATRNDFDREKMSVRSKTSGDQINRKVKNLSSALTQDAFVDYHFKDGAKRKAAADNPRKSTARQIIADVGMDIFKEDLKQKGELYKAFEDRMDLLELALGDEFVNTVLNDLDSTEGGARFSKLQDDILAIPGYQNFTKNDTIALLNSFTADRASFEKDHPAIYSLFLTNAINEVGLLEELEEKGNKSTAELISSDDNMDEMGFSGNMFHRMPSSKSPKRKEIQKNYFSAVTEILEYLPKQIAFMQTAKGGNTPFIFLTHLLGFNGNGSGQNGLVGEATKLYSKADLYSKSSETAKYWKEFYDLGGFTDITFETSSALAATFNRDLLEIVQDPKLKTNEAKIAAINKLKTLPNAKKNFNKLRALDYAMSATIAHVADKKGEPGSEARNKFLEDVSPYFSNTDRYGKRVLAPFTSINLNPDILIAGKYKSRQVKGIKEKKPGQIMQQKGEHWRPMAQMSYLDLKNLVNGFYERDAFDKVRAGFENSLGENRVWAVLDQLLGPTTGASKEARIIGLEMLLQDLKQFRTKGPASERIFATEEINNISLQGSSSIYNWVKGEYEFESIVRNQNKELLKDQAKELKKFNLTPQPDSFGNMLQGTAYNEKVRFSKPGSDFQYADMSTILGRPDVKMFDNMVSNATGINVEKLDANQVRNLAKRNYLKTAFNTGLAVWYDLEQFFYPIYGKGLEGKKQQRLVHNKIITPLIQGMNNFHAYEASTREQIATLNKGRKGMGLEDASITEEVITGYTLEDAIRVWIYRANDFTIPGISDENINTLFNRVNEDSNLRRYALNLRRIFAAYPWAKPEANWSQGNLITDINSVMGIARMEMLTRFKENVDQVFTKTNLQKLEAKFGTPYVTFLQKKIKNVYTGKPPSSGGALDNKFIKYMSRIYIAGTMWGNFKSGLIQHLSFLNYWPELEKPGDIAFLVKNGFKKEYDKAWDEIKNSDFLKERRRLGRFDVVARESTAFGQDITKFEKFFLEKGYAPTKWGDKNAILFGGAAHYAINYMKARQGVNPMSEAEAREQAFVKFIEATEGAQQSSRADRLGFAQQAPVLRYLTTYTNTQQQQSRKITNAIRDVAAGRISGAEAFVKIGTYGIYAPVSYLLLSKLGGNMIDYVKMLIAGGEDDEIEEDANKFLLGYVQGMTQGLGPMGIIVQKLVEEIYYQTARNGVDYYGGDLSKRLIGFAPFLSSFAGGVDKFGKVLKSDDLTETIVPALKELGKPLPGVGKLIKVGDAISRGVENDLSYLENWAKMFTELIGWSNYYIENAEKEFTPIQRKNIDNTFKKILSPSTERAIERASKKAEKIAEKYAKKY